jgi:PAS domain S-box-containing protein
MKKGKNRNHPAKSPSKRGKPSYEALEREVLALRNRIGKTLPSKPGMLESEEKYRVIFENANDLIVYTDLEGRFIELNDKLEEIFGYKREDFIGKRFTEVDVLGPRDLKKARKDLRNTIAGNPRQVSEFEVFRKDGTKAFVEVNSRLIKIDGRTRASILIIRDITERKKAEEALRKVHEELERKVRERTLNLEEANTALRVLLRKRDEDRMELQERMLMNLKELILPYLEKMKKSLLDERQRTLLEIIESNLRDILSPLTRQISASYLHFTPTEIQVANLVRSGKTTKEIAELLVLSTKTIEFHRENIRSKIGIKNKKVNLRTHLLSFPDPEYLPGNLPVKF